MIASRNPEKLQTSDKTVRKTKSSTRHPNPK
jgi:hypothetical protein